MTSGRLIVLGILVALLSVAFLEYQNASQLAVPQQEASTAADSASSAQKTMHAEKTDNVGQGEENTGKAADEKDDGDSTETCGISINDTSLDSNYCCCTAKEVDAGTKDLLTLLNGITIHPYFRYFKINSEKACPYWAVTLLCSSENACDVCKCNVDAVPHSLREEKDMSEVDEEASRVSHSVSHPSNIEDWGNWKGIDVQDNEAHYVDLVQHPEANTGFTGPLATRVWSAIYNENCLTNIEDDQCHEVTVLKTLFSGLHMSINLHVCTNFYKDTNMSSPHINAGVNNNPNISFFPNCDMYRKRVAAVPQFVENLYVLYQFLLRALTKAEDVIMGDMNRYNTGSNGEATESDEKLKQMLSELFASKLLCVKTFDEARFLESEKGRDLIPQMKLMVQNVTKLMDCVPCEKCRIWGKLEVKGIATALKITMHNSHSEALALDRSEVVSLV
ncbi:endoplasmic reticulum oxidoreductin [Strigomonas culicis]|nr:endoplasmic reticulum oxidoreductin [Strigomonas culicis]|eukprot:EPY23892.1 endoplasmic reticulum oxidoreductin [Strigomonas culicis]